jgi:hypothetical protein
MQIRFSPLQIFADTGHLPERGKSVVFDPSQPPLQPTGAASGS